MIKRDMYIQKLMEAKDKRLIKILTGIRRAGKSSIFRMYQDLLISSGVKPNQIISINFEDMDFEYLLDKTVLYTYLKEHLIPDKINYIFLDEIQNVPEFQKVVDSLYIKDNVDIYLTGSNAYLLSGEIATLLSGRYIEIKILPLSFKEYISAFPDKNDLRRKYNNYLTNSSFPYTLYLRENKELISDYLQGIYNTVILKDIVARKKIADVSVLERVIRFMFDSIGSTVSVAKISNTLTSYGRKISNHTVENYLVALCDSYILNKVTRFDIKGKQHLKVGEKYYLTDIGLRYMLLGSKNTDYGHILENIIFLELIRRGYEVFVGKLSPGILSQGTFSQTEVDFVATKNGTTEYYQVAFTVVEHKILERELRPLDLINDHNAKFLLTLDEVPETSHNGIKQINALDWLLK